MKANHRNAALHTFQGIKKIGDIIDLVEDGQLPKDRAMDMIMNTFYEYQPQSSAYAVNEYFESTEILENQICNKKGLESED